MLLLTVLASLALATEDIKRARLEVGAIFMNYFLLYDFILSMLGTCRLAVDDD